MKKYILILIFALPIALAAQMTYVPDDNFELALIDLGLDTGPLNDSVPTKNIESILELRVVNRKIADFTGIEDFKALETFICPDNKPTKFDISKNLALKILNCGYNELTSLDVSKNTTLWKLYCSNNSLTSLDVSKNTALEKLYCDNNTLTSLDVSKNTALKEFDCSYNSLTSLDVSKNTALTWLYCWNNSLTSLDVSKNTALTELICDYNALTSLDVSKNTALTWMRCSNNSLTSLDVSKNTALIWLGCSFNNLTSLDVSGCTSLEGLDCYYNGLTSLDVSKNTALWVLDCVDNPDLYCIQVADSAEATYEEDWKKDAHAVWSEDCSLVSVEEASNTENIGISPNPAGDYIEINNVILSEAKNLCFQVYDMLGVEVASTGMSFLRKQESHGSFNEIPNQVGNDIQVVRIDVSGLPKGVYFVRVGDIVQKFVKI